MKKSDSLRFYEAWNSLPEWAVANLDISVVRMNALTGRIEDDDSLNVDTQIWLESGPCDDGCEGDLHRHLATHDIRLDCGHFTFELAIMAYAKLVKKFYPNSTKDHA